MKLYERASVLETGSVSVSPEALWESQRAKDFLLPHCPSKCHHSGLIDAGLICLNMARLSSERVHFLPLMTSGNNSRPFTLLSLLREQNGCSGIYFSLQMNSAQRLFKKMFLYGFPASQAMKGATLSAFFRRLIHLEVMHLQIVPFFSSVLSNPSILKS